MRAIIVFTISILCLLPGYDKIWAPYDEGFILEASYMAAKGLVPYKDFFILMYPPGQIYSLAALFNIFGTTLNAARLYTIFWQAVVCLSVFVIVRRFARPFYAVLAFAPVLITIAAIAEAIPRPMWPAIALGLLSVWSLLPFFESGKIRYLGLASFLTGLSILFKHDIGLLTFAACFTGILVYKLFVRHRSRWPMAIYATFPLLFIGATAVWLSRYEALNDAVRSLVLFPRVFCNNAATQIPFPPFCMDFGMIFHRGCLYIKDNQFYIPVVICAATTLFISIELILKKKVDKKITSIIVLLLLAAFYLQQVIVRADPGHLAAAFAPSAILFGLLFTYDMGKSKFLKTIKTAGIFYISLLMALFIYKNLELYYKNFIAKTFIKKTIKEVKFKHGSAYLPDDGRTDFIALVKYIEDNTVAGEKIYIGNLKHMVPQYGWNELVYFLTERLPAVKYYEMHPGLQDDEAVQREMIRSLEENGTRVLLLRDFGDTQKLGPLDKYIKASYRADKIIGSCHIYVKK